MWNNAWLVIKGIPLIFALIKAVESVFPSGTGSAKLDLVMKLLQAFEPSFKEIADKVREIIGIIVDTFNKTGIFSTTKEVVADIAPEQVNNLAKLAGTMAFDVTTNPPGYKTR